MGYLWSFLILSGFMCVCNFLAVSVSLYIVQIYRSHLCVHKAGPLVPMKVNCDIFFAVSAILHHTLAVINESKFLSNTV